MSRKSGAKNSTSTVATALANRLRNHRERRNSIPSSCAEPQAATATNNHHLRLVISTHPHLALLPPSPLSVSRWSSSASDMPSRLKNESLEARRGVIFATDGFSMHQKAVVSLPSSVASTAAPPQMRRQHPDTPSPPPCPAETAEASELVVGPRDGFLPHSGGTGGVYTLPTSAASFVSPPPSRGGCRGRPSPSPRSRSAEAAEASEIVAGPGDSFSPLPGRHRWCS